MFSDSQVEESSCGVWIGDGNGFSGVLDNGSVPEFWHVNVAITAYELSESAIIEPRRANASGDSDVYEEGRLETSALFEGIKGLNELRGGVPPTPVPEGEERDGTVLHQWLSSFIGLPKHR